ncbi:MAG TPA: methyltransferase domain-containing protein [Pseudonocardiaceae bacterium]|nr:methyltransferase domain-containing protein [Pseudonocardiaceae bacterium]
MAPPYNSRPVNSSRQGTAQRPPGRGLGFIAAAVRSPREVGTLLPSGPELARRLAAVVPRDGPRGRPMVVVEIGAGDGAVTGALAERAGPDAVVIAVEKDPELAQRLRARGLAGVQVVTADAATLPAILAERGVALADVIVSVLPWTFIGPRQQREFLATFSAALRPDGVFTAAAYSSGYWTSAARRFRDELGRTFGEVLPTRTMWRHVPPAMTYVCRHPVQPAPEVSGDRSR